MVGYIVGHVVVKYATVPWDPQEDGGVGAIKEPGPVSKDIDDDRIQ